MPKLTPDSYPRILDSMPHVIMRLIYREPKWTVLYVNKAIERYGYNKDDFLSGGMSWNDLLHPDDRVVALKQSHDYLANNIDDFKLQYRIAAKNGKSIYISEYSHVNHEADGCVTIDSFLFEDLETRSAASPDANPAVQRNLALNDILLTLQDAAADPEKAIQFILDRVGALIDCSRALLFRDSPDHKTCKVVYEWLNHDITSVKDLDYSVTYSTGMPEIYVALQDTGVLLVNAGEIPENCKEEFEAEGLLSSAIFAVYQQGDHYGFVCFDDCIIERRWDPETAQFLKVVANMLSNAVMQLQSNQYMRDYENTIKSLAFRDYLTGLPNHYPYDSDIGDIILSASAAGSPGYAVMIGARNSGDVRNSHGLRTSDRLCKEIAGEIQRLATETLGNRATTYRIAGGVFAVLVQPGPVEPVRAFAEAVNRRGHAPWLIDSKEYACLLNVSATPFGVKNVDPEAIFDRLDAAVVQSGAQPGSPLVFLTEE